MIEVISGRRMGIHGDGNSMKGRVTHPTRATGEAWPRNTTSDVLNAFNLYLLNLPGARTRLARAIGWRVVIGGLRGRRFGGGSPDPRRNRGELCWSMRRPRANNKEQMACLDAIRCPMRLSTTTGGGRGLTSLRTTARHPLRDRPRLAARHRSN